MRMRSNEQLPYEENTMLHFERVNHNHKDLIASWFKENHVAKYFYGKGLHNTFNNLELYYRGINNNGRYTFDFWLAFSNSIPFGFLITSPITGPYNPKDDYNKWFVHGKYTFTLDLLIGPKEFLGKGFSTKMIRNFILDKFKDADYFIIDPAKSNSKAIHVYQKIGFKKVDEFYPAYDPNCHHVMMRLGIDDFKIKLHLD